MSCLVAGSLGVSGASAAQDKPIEATADEAQASIDAIDGSQEQDDISADQASLDSELASAKRFEAELDALLLSNGQLDSTRSDALPKLRSLATRCGILANSAMHEEVRLVLLGYQARALSALASLVPADQAEDAGWIEQLNDTAQQIMAIDLPGAAPAADYWQLIGEVSRQAATKKPPTQRQALIEQLLSAFIDKHAKDDDAAEYLVDTRLSLAQLMDQRGAQRDVAQQLDKLGDLPADSQRLGEAQQLRQSVARLGTPINFESISTQLTRWRASDHLGKPVLIHVYADSVEPAVHMIDVISRSIVEGSLSGIAVVSLRVGEPIAGTNAPPWPTLPVQLEPNGVLDSLGVTALPTLAWLDEQGKLVSIGTTPAVLDQLSRIVPAEPDDQAEQADDRAEPAVGTDLNQDPSPDPAAEPAPVKPAESIAPEPDDFPF
ncbi:MAG: TlpA family protein disulfide reductase [Phycisphaeraceae bacterium]